MIVTERINYIGVVRLHRPDSRNALTGEMLRELTTAMLNFDRDPDIRVIVLTGSDPAFCAGLDLRDLANIYNGAVADPETPPVAMRSLMPLTVTPIIGAINGAAVTGGLELALGCDFLIASERATFADTHARVGIMPAGGMTIRLPQLVGVNRARQMSLTGNFISATTANEWGLVNEVVDHGNLMTRVVEVATAIAECDPAAVTYLRSMYADLAHRSDPEVYRDEARRSRTWMKEKFSSEHLDAQREQIIQRGRSQQ